jgi:hypothetical protein
MLISTTTKNIIYSYTADLNFHNFLNESEIIKKNDYYIKNFFFIYKTSREMYKKKLKKKS